MPGDDANRLLGGRYRLGERLGRGGASTVHSGVDIVLGRPIAVKLYRPMDSTTGMYRFASEARLLAGLSHPGLVAVYDVNLDGDQPYLVMQLVNGPTLRDLLDRGPLTPEVVVRLGVRLAEVLAYIHEHDIVHRDIKPSNVLVDESGTFHLTDFGIARALSAAHLTTSGEFVGTAAYLAPEQVTDVDTGPAVDIYSLGLLLLECLTGRTEYTGTTVEAALARLARSPRIPDTLPPAWRSVLTAMTAQDPAARPDALRCAGLLATVEDGPATDGAAVPPPAPVSATSAPIPASFAPVPAKPEAVPAKPAPVAARSRSRARLAPVTLAAAVLAAVAAVVMNPAIIPGLPSGDPEPARTRPAAPGPESVGDSTQPTGSGDNDGGGNRQSGDEDGAGDGAGNGGGDGAVPAVDPDSPDNPAGTTTTGNAGVPPATGQDPGSPSNTPTTTEAAAPPPGTETSNNPGNRPTTSKTNKGKGKG